MKIPVERIKAIVINTEENSAQIVDAYKKKDENTWEIELRLGMKKPLQFKLPLPPPKALKGRLRKSKMDYLVIGTKDWVNFYYLTNLNGVLSWWQCEHCNTAYNDLEYLIKKVVLKKKITDEKTGKEKSVKEPANVPVCDTCQGINFRTIKVDLTKDGLKAIPQNFMDFDESENKRVHFTYQKGKGLSQYVIPVIFLISVALVVVAVWHLSDAYKAAQITCNIAINGTALPIPGA